VPLLRVLGVAALAVAMCCPSTAARAQNEPYDVNVILPLTGVGAFIGQTQAAAFKVVEKRINATGGIDGRPVRFVEADNQSDPQVDVQLTGALIAKHVPVIVDGGPATDCNAAAPLYARGPLMYCLSPAFYPEKDGYAFAGGVTSRDGLRAIVNYLRGKGWTRIAILTLTDVAGQEADQALHDLLALPVNRAFNVVGWEHYAPRDLSVTTQLAKLRAGNPQALIGWATGTPVGTMFHGLVDAAWDVPFMGSNANQQAGSLVQLASVLPRDYYMFSLPWAAYSRMKDGVLKAATGAYLDALHDGGLQPDGGNAMVWDSMMIVTSALRKLGTQATADQLKGYISGLHNFDGAGGSFNFTSGNQRGLGPENCIVVRWDRATGAWIPVSGPDGSTLPS
jgi:branched-chain amino acid transport system substrate-binding protein